MDFIRKAYQTTNIINIQDIFTRSINKYYFINAIFY